MEEPPLDERSPMARAAAWSSTITTISMEMVVPIVLGYWADSWLGTRIVFVILGAIGGMTLGMVHLVRLVSVTPAGNGGPTGEQASGDKSPDGRAANGSELDRREK